MKRTSMVIVAVFALVGGASLVVHHLNDFARVQAAQIGSTPFEPGTLSQVVIRNNSARKIAFQLRCDYKVQPGREMFSHELVMAPRSSIDVDVNPELAGRDLPAMIANKSCEATWRGPFGVRCRAWRVNWQYSRPAHKGIMLAEEDGACRIATCYSTSRLVNLPSCLSAVYLAPGRQRKS